jgi:four helix bundle protein
MANGGAPYHSYAEWELSVPAGIKDDPLWSVRAYRVALFMIMLVRFDYGRLRAARHPLADQLYRAVGSIGANIAEGYSRSSPRERAHFFEYAFGSARESRHWYYAVEADLGSQLTEHRLAQLQELIRLLVAMIRIARNESILSQDRAKSGS